MPRIPDVYLDCVIYLFKTEDDATKPIAQTPAGSGFLVRIDEEAYDSSGSSHKSVPHVYAVTCAHVIEGGGCVISLNNDNGGKATVSTERKDWIKPDDGDDIAVYPLDLGDQVRYSCLSLDESVSNKMLEMGEVSIGDEVFMVGRFSGHPGKEQNTPVVRFGNVAMMPHDPIAQPRGHNQLSYLAEMRSLPGLSGSPVFLYQPYVSFREINTRIMKYGNQNPAATGSNAIPLELGNPLFLGVDWGTIQINTPGQALDNIEQSSSQVHSGFAAVVPAWQLVDLLMSEAVKRKRQKATD